jgi:hypothetical protein
VPVAILSVASFHNAYQSTSLMHNGYKVQIKLPEAFVVSVVVMLLCNRPVFIAMSDGILVAVYSGMRIDAIAWVLTPSYLQVVR